jgi:hypothetical protein
LAHRRAWRAGLWLGLLFIGGCALLGVQEGPLHYETLLKGSYSGIRDARFEVIRDQAAYRALWQAHTSSVGTGQLPPEVNFSDYMVVVAYLGSRPTGGYRVNISGVEVRDGKVHVTVTGHAPGAGCLATQAFTQPFHLVKVRRVDLPVEFSKETVRDDCK